jgi:hypothetical protein
MNPDLPFCTARSALKNCVGYLYDAKDAETPAERIDNLDGACQYAQQALDALHDAAFYFDDIGSDLPGVRQPEIVRTVVDGNAHAAYGDLLGLTRGFVGVALESVSLDAIPLDSISTLMEAYAGSIALEEGYSRSVGEPDC